jgi:hypothetical protein
VIGRVISTSVRQGFGAGPGFQQVLRTKGLVPVVCERAEQLSGYEHPFDPGDARNPIRFFHRIATLQGKRWHFLGRVSDAATDYSGRSNRLSQVLVLDENEIRHLGCGPAAVLQGFAWEQGWGDDRQPQLEATCPPPRLTSPSKPRCQEWRKTCGDSGWGGELARAANENQRVSLVVGPTDNTLRLFAEAMELLPPEKRWQVEFSTWEHAAAGLGWRAVRSDIERLKTSVDTAAKTYDLASIKADGLTAPNKHSVFVRTARGEALEVPFQSGIIEEKGGGGAAAPDVPPSPKPKNEEQGDKEADNPAERAAQDATKKIAEACRLLSGGNLDAALEAASNALKKVSPHAGVNPACRRMEERAAELRACIERKIRERRRNLVFWFVVPSLFIALSICAVSLGHLLGYWYPSEDTNPLGSSTERADGLSRAFAHSQSVPSHDDGDIDSASGNSGKEATGKATVGNRASSENDAKTGAGRKGEAGNSPRHSVAQKGEMKPEKAPIDSSDKTPALQEVIESISQSPELLPLPALINHEPCRLGIPWNHKTLKDFRANFVIRSRIDLNWGAPVGGGRGPGAYLFSGFQVQPSESERAWRVRCQWKSFGEQKSADTARLVVVDDELCWQWEPNVQRNIAAAVLFSELTVGLSGKVLKTFTFLRGQQPITKKVRVRELFAESPPRIGVGDTELAACVSGAQDANQIHRLEWRDWKYLGANHLVSRLVLEHGGHALGFGGDALILLQPKKDLPKGALWKKFDGGGDVSLDVVVNFDRVQLGRGGYVEVAADCHWKRNSKIQPTHCGVEGRDLIILSKDELWRKYDEFQKTGFLRDWQSWCEENKDVSLSLGDDVRSEDQIKNKLKNEPDLCIVIDENMKKILYAAEILERLAEFQGVEVGTRMKLLEKRGKARMFSERVSRVRWFDDNASTEGRDYPLEQRAHFLLEHKDEKPIGQILNILEEILERFDSGGDELKELKDDVDRFLRSELTLAVSCGVFSTDMLPGDAVGQGPYEFPLVGKR